MTRSFIRDNYASQVGKGTHYGLDRLQEFMRRFYRKNGIDGWILKGDISKYFYSIRHDVLKTLIREKITDPDVLWLVDLIIDSTEGNVGIPIGNQTSQLFALLYLDGLDHFVKESWVSNITGAIWTTSFDPSRQSIFAGVPEAD